MKKLVLIFAILFALIVNAQETPKYVYSEIVGTSKFLSTKVLIQIDYGQATSIWESNRVKMTDLTEILIQWLTL